MKKQEVKTNRTIKNFLKKILSKNAFVLLEDELYRVDIPKDFFEPTFLDKMLGLKVWKYALGGADCGKRCVKYLAKLQKKYEYKYGSWAYEHSASGMPAVVLGFVKYKRDVEGDWHIICSSVIQENGKLKMIFFERGESCVNWKKLSNKEIASIKYFHAY